MNIYCTMAGSCGYKRGYLQNAESRLFDASPICVRAMHDNPASVLRVNRAREEARLNPLATDMHNLYAVHVSW